MIREVQNRFVLSHHYRLVGIAIYASLFIQNDYTLFSIVIIPTLLGGMGMGFIPRSLFVRAPHSKPSGRRLCGTH